MRRECADPSRHVMINGISAVGSENNSVNTMPGVGREEKCKKWSILPGPRVGLVAQTTQKGLVVRLFGFNRPSTDVPFGMTRRGKRN
jgi:hypothetical protein